MPERTENRKIASERELVITRDFAAPRELVFAAWTDPRNVARWWGPKGFTNPRCEVDARPGGALLIHMRSPEGVIVPVRGTFLEVESPTRLVYRTAAFEDEHGNAQLEVINTVTFEVNGEATRLTLRAEIITATDAVAALLAGMEEGWNQSLDRLTSYVATVATLNDRGISMDHASSDNTVPVALRTTGYAPVNGLQMYYEVHGEGDPLLLLHGGLQTIDFSVGGNLLPSLAQTHQVIAVEQQAHGHTADIDRPLDYEQMVEDTAALLRHLEISTADVFGYSMGGMTALGLATRHPDLVRKLVVVSAPFNNSGMRPENLAGMMALTPEALAGSPQEAAYRQTAPNPDDWGSLLSKVGPMQRDFKGWPAEDVRAITAPTLLVYGDNDAIPLDHAVELFRLRGGDVNGDFVGVPASHLAILPGTTHISIMDRTDILLPIVSTFLDESIGEA
jgi:uncharacterized protein YndB with AHSA1/START domain/pimeloyl-ACP methyl ester carboxylesterase